VVNLQVSDAKERAVELRALVSARNAPQTWDLRCEVREKLVEFLQREYPHALPTARVQLHARAAVGAGQRAGGETEPVAVPAAEREGTTGRHQHWQHHQDRFAA
jgi:hypothetical protein